MTTPKRSYESARNLLIGAQQVLLTKRDTFEDEFDERIYREGIYFEALARWTWTAKRRAELHEATMRMMSREAGKVTNQ